MTNWISVSSKEWINVHEAIGIPLGQSLMLQNIGQAPLAFAESVAPPADNLDYVSKPDEIVKVSASVVGLWVKQFRGNSGDGLLVCRTADAFEKIHGYTITNQEATSEHELSDVYVPSIKQLPPEGRAGVTYWVSGFYENTIDGGGRFDWLPAAGKSLHNGVTHYSPEAIAAWNGTHGDLATLLHWVGGGAGVWVRRLSGYVTPEMAGANYATDDSLSIAAAHKAPVKKVVYDGGKNYLVKQANLIEIFDGVLYEGNNCIITVPSDTAITDDAGNFGRWANNIFYRSSPNAMDKNIHLRNFVVQMNARKINFIGCVSTSSVRDNHKGTIFISKIIFNGIGERPGLGGPDGAFAECGALLYANGYRLKLNDLNIYDCGNAVIGFSSKLFFARNVRTHYCGVSRDHTTWVNAASLLARGSEIIDIKDCYSYITGGTSYFLSHDQVEPVKSVRVRDCKLVGCGLSAIGTGTRNYSPSAGRIEEIILTGIEISGFTCAIDANLHSGVKVSLEDTLGSTLDYGLIDCEVDYLAPWETYNEADGDVDGSFNINKTKGYDVGSQYSILSFPASGNKISKLEIKGRVLNHQRGGVYVEKINDLVIDIYAFNNGWSKDNSNSAYSTQNSVYVRECQKAIVKADVDKNAHRLIENKAFCTPVFIRSNPDISVDVRVRNNGNQIYPVRIVNDIDGCKTVFIGIDFDAPLVSGGFTYTVDTSSGAYSKKHLIKSGIASSVLMTGSREVPEFTMLVKDSAGVPGNKTATLMDARMYDGRIIEFIASASWSITITPAPSNTIDGSEVSLVVPVNQSRRILSMNGAWLSV